MNKNTKTYTLLGGVLLIWGIIGFKIYSALSPEEDTLALVEDVMFKSKKAVQRDTFTIKADYRDPFLGKFGVSSKKRAIKTTKKKTVSFPQINYTGLITDQKTKKHIFFVTITGTQYLMQRGNQQNEVTLVSGSSKQIRVRYKGVVKTIPLQNATL